MSGGASTSVMKVRPSAGVYRNVVRITAVLLRLGRREVWLVSRDRQLGGVVGRAQLSSGAATPSVINSGPSAGASVNVATNTVSASVGL